MAIAFVQATGTGATKTSGNLSVPLTNLPTVGNRLLLLVATDTMSVAITDPRSNTWTGIGTITNGEPMGIWSAPVTNGYTAGDALTVTTGLSFTRRSVTVAEFSGIDTTTPVRASSFIGNANTVATTSPTITTPISAQTGDLVIGGLSSNGPTGDTFTADNDTVNGSWASGVGTFTRTSTSGGSATSNDTIAGQHKIVTATGAQTFNPTITSRVCNILSVILVPAVVVPPNPRSTQVVAQAVTRAATWMKRHDHIVVPRLWTPADAVGT